MNKQDSKFCKGCKQNLPLTAFWRGRSGVQHMCIACAKAYKKGATSKAVQKNWRVRLREQALKMYGEKCQCCGISAYEHLAIDHVYGGGGKQRREKSLNITWQLRKDGYPEGFQVLCHNCNQAAGMYGYCPHNPIPSEVAELEKPREKAGAKLGAKLNAVIIGTDGTKSCTKCLEMKPLSEFWKMPRAPLGLNWRCKQCLSAYHQTDKGKLAGKRWRKDVRREVLAYYGGQCACCAETRYEFLAMDHIRGDGASHRRSMNTKNLAYWLKKNGFPEGFQVYCHNCNMAYGRYGYCPHKQVPVAEPTPVLVSEP